MYALQKLRRLRGVPIRFRLLSLREVSNAGVIVDDDDMVIVQRAVGPFQMNQYLLACKHTQDAAFIDSGEAPEEFFGGWADSNFFKVKHLVQTHAHIDHVAGLAPTKRLYPDSPLYMHKADLPVYNSVLQRAAMFGMRLETPLPPVDVFVADGDTLSVGKITLQVLFTPGHCPGHCVYFHDHPTRPVAFVGDLIFRNSVGRTDLPLCDPAAMEASVRRVMQSLPTQTLLLPGHMEVTSVAAEMASNPFVNAWLTHK